MWGDREPEFLMDVSECHPPVMYNSGIDLGRYREMESLINQVG